MSQSAAHQRHEKRHLTAFPSIQQSPAKATQLWRGSGQRAQHQSQLSVLHESGRKQQRIHCLSRPATELQSWGWPAEQITITCWPWLVWTVCSTWIQWVKTFNATFARHSMHDLTGYLNGFVFLVNRTYVSDCDDSDNWLHHFGFTCCRGKVTYPEYPWILKSHDFCWLWADPGWEIGR